MKYIKLANCKNFDVKANGTIFACTGESVYKYDKNNEDAELVCNLVDFVQQDSLEDKDAKSKEE